MRSSGEVEPNLVRAAVEHPPPDFAQLLDAIDDSEEVISGKRPRAAGERHVAVREEQLSLADRPGVPEQLARPRPARRVLGLDA